MAETILEEAQRIIYGDREQTYGHPAKNFENTAAFWRTWLLSKHGSTPPIDTEDVAMMMTLLKLARQAHGHKRDNLVDLCGYAACIQKVLDYGAQARDNILPVSSPTHVSAGVPPEDAQPVRGRPSRLVVLGAGSGSVGGVEVRDPGEATSNSDRSHAKPIAAHVAS